jgi:hypothetical protein
MFLRFQGIWSFVHETADVLDLTKELCALEVQLVMFLY